jgi:hypothetical protein
MSSVQSAVRACGDGAHATMTVNVTFNGESGAVSNVDASGGNFAPAVRSCVARAVRGAHVSRFRQPTLRVTYPFNI